MALVGIEIDSLVFYARTSSIRTDTALAAASLSCVAGCAIAFLLFIEYRHSLRPTALLSLYIIISFVLDVVKSRSYFIRSGLQTLGGLSAVAAGLKLCLIILQEIPKRHLLVSDDLRDSTGKEATSGFFYRQFFGWLNSIFKSGFNSVLEVKDLERLSPDLSSMCLYPKFVKIWDKSEKGTETRQLSIC